MKHQVYLQQHSMRLELDPNKEVGGLSAVRAIVDPVEDLLLYETDNEEPFEELLTTFNGFYAGCIFNEEGKGEMFAAIGGKVLHGPQVSWKKQEEQSDEQPEGTS